MATIIKFQRRHIPDLVVTAPCGVCDGCTKPNGEFFEDGRSLGFGLNDPQSAAITRGTAGEQVADSPFITFGAYELRGYGSCAEQAPQPALVLNFTLDDGRAGYAVLGPMASEDEIDAAVADWITAHPVPQADALVGRTY